MNKGSLTQLYQVYPKAQFSNQFYVIFFCKDFFFFIPKTSVHNFAKTLKELLPILKSECEAAINWLHDNKMIINPDKFQVILLDKVALIKLTWK